MRGDQRVRKWRKEVRQLDLGRKEREGEKIISKLHLSSLFITAILQSRENYERSCRFLPKFYDEGKGVLTPPKSLRTSRSAICMKIYLPVN